MSVWRPTPASQEPVTKIMSWSIYEVPVEGGEPTIHFVGCLSHGGFAYSGEGRVSSAIQSFDKSQKCGISKSGRKYVLSGPPGYNSDANYVWNNWCSINKVSSYADVTDSYTK